MADNPEAPEQNPDFDWRYDLEDDDFVTNIIQMAQAVHMWDGLADLTYDDLKRDNPHRAYVIAVEYRTLRIVDRFKSLNVLDRMMAYEGFPLATAGGSIFRDQWILFRPLHYGHENATGAEGCRYVRVATSSAAGRRWIVDFGWRVGVGSIAPEAIADFITASEVSAAGDDLLRILRPADSSSQDQPLHSPFLPAVVDGSARLDAIARRLGWPAHVLTRRFRKLKGTTPITYRRQARLHKALDYLAHSDQSVASIAGTVGYCDQGHLARVLKREIGLTAHQFKRLVTEA